jgi:hypothetical protein
MGALESRTIYMGPNAINAARFNVPWAGGTVGQTRSATLSAAAVFMGAHSLALSAMNSTCFADCREIA